MRLYEDYMVQTADELQLQVMQNAARFGDLRYFSTLLLTGGDFLKERDNKGYSPFMLACYHGHFELVQLLLKNGANPNDADFDGNSVLMGAAFKGHRETVHLLIQANADVNAKNKSGQDALLFAQMFGRNEILTLLRPDRQTSKPDRLSVFTRLSAWQKFFKLQLTTGEKK